MEDDSREMCTKAEVLSMLGVMARSYKCICISSVVVRIWVKRNAKREFLRIKPTTFPTPIKENLNKYRNF